MKSGKVPSPKTGVWVKKFLPIKIFEPGDTLVFLYVKTYATDPGIYGWGIVSWCNQEELHFRPVFPSDYLKVNPVPVVKVAKFVDKLRGGMKMGTMWEMEQELFEKFRKEISKHINQKPSQPISP